MGGGVGSPMPQLTGFDGVSPTALYLVLFFAGLVETVFPPVPGDAVTVLGSFALARKGCAPALGLALSWAGSYLGGLFLWACGGRLSSQAGTPSTRGRDAVGLGRAIALLGRHGILLVVVSRFVPGIRSLILVAAGFARMPLRRVAWALAIAVAAWQSLLVAGGYLVGRRWLAVVDAWGKAGVGMLAVALLAAAAWWRWRRRGISGGDDDSG